MFNEVFQYINENKLHSEVLKVANKVNNIRMAMILIYYKIPVTDDIIELSTKLNAIEEENYAKFINHHIGGFKNEI